MKQLIYGLIGFSGLLLTPCVVVAESAWSSSDAFSVTKQAQPWYKKVNYFAHVSQQKQDLRLSRHPSNRAIHTDKFSGEHSALIATASVGGKLFKRSIVYADLLIDKTQLKGDIRREGESMSTDFVDYQRYKSQVEIFYEFALTSQLSIGADLYFASEQYRQSMHPKTRKDKYAGGAVVFSMKPQSINNQFDIDYILSYRHLSPGSAQLASQSQVFHTVLLHYQFYSAHALNAYLSGRVSYFPQYDPNSYWESHAFYVLSTHIEYRLTDTSLLSMRLERGFKGQGQSMQTWAVNYEYRFGVTKTKRRKRRYKMPNLLIK
ncbi:hypothetical protein CWB96_06225 [Pseudoalteromonas citrea]|uniref:DUF3570 domain-containing protein n=1 Tax=Pseudoalteromonas citrea TaxID=43655 RepID=A0A5S3XTE5_9GAMM|nr:hypothetical protein [Pseudoalteromonas citrea]TMP41785.1 hypothetical protein CWB97_13535 [Pseudoalteromonas citrea]TMP60562.1 hypothetical protein CWB96_06225 [Pseudoalteromonas citrea]